MEWETDDRVHESASPPGTCLRIQHGHSQKAGRLGTFRLGEQTLIKSGKCTLQVKQVHKIPSPRF